MTGLHYLGLYRNTSLSIWLLGLKSLVQPIERSDIWIQKVLLKTHPVQFVLPIYREGDQSTRATCLKKAYSHSQQPSTSNRAEGRVETCAHPPPQAGVLSSAASDSYSLSASCSTIPEPWEEETPYKHPCGKAGLVENGEWTWEELGERQQIWPKYIVQDSHWTRENEKKISLLIKTIITWYSILKTLICRYQWEV